MAYFRVSSARGMPALPGKALDLGPADRFESETAHRPAVERVVAAIRAPSGGALSLGDMADLAHLSPFHFARTFKGVTGISPGEFGSAVRLQRAKELLLTTDLTASEVCFEVGYGSFGTFSTRFAQLFGVSPGRMRRLPEELRVARTGTEAAPPTADVGVSFEVGGDVPAGARIFVGLFPGAIPQRVPAAGTVLTAAGTHRLGPVPDGVYHVMAAALPPSEDPLDSLLPGEGLRVGRGDCPALVRGGRGAGLTSVRMREVGALDPPLLLALPALLPGSLASA